MKRTSKCSDLFEATINTSKVRKARRITLRFLQPTFNTSLHLSKFNEHALQIGIQLLLLLNKSIPKQTHSDINFSKNKLDTFGISQPTSFYSIITDHMFISVIRKCNSSFPYPNQLSTSFQVSSIFLKTQSKKKKKPFGATFG